MKPVIIVIFVLIFPLFGCTTLVSQQAPLLDDCLDQVSLRLSAKPVQPYLKTLDGQEVLLSEFFQKCLVHAPVCSLPEKFYHWKNVIKIIESKTERGVVSHKIRIYHNHMTTCAPDNVDPQKTHGDIAEFYNEKGVFMGLAVYAGNGLYSALPYAKYKEQRSINDYL